jgi:hypothetical protein
VRTPRDHLLAILRCDRQKLVVSRQPPVALARQTERLRATLETLAPVLETAQVHLRRGRVELPVESHHISDQRIAVSLVG